ncbi:hypothetical protein, partial [Streptomyces sp. 8L]|uniref:hypothetical protein n=1 Tax=Streptomyces sp. 8L TaxID=2877242 RepID=UPI001CD5343F
MQGAQQHEAVGLPPGEGDAQQPAAEDEKHQPPVAQDRCEHAGHGLTAVPARVAVPAPVSVP